MKLVKPLPHAVLDYALAFVFLAAPALFSFESQEARTIAHASGALYIVASLVTRYPLGLLRLIPFPVHGVLETLMALAWLVTPWMMGFAGEPAARNFFIVAAVALLGLALVTDYRGAEASQRANRRHGATERRVHFTRVQGERRVSGPRRRSPYAAA